MLFLFVGDVPVPLPLIYSLGTCFPSLEVAALIIAHIITCNRNDTIYYYRVIVCFPIVLVFITFHLHFFLYFIDNFLCLIKLSLGDVKSCIRTNNICCVLTFMAPTFFFQLRNLADDITLRTLTKFLEDRESTRGTLLVDINHKCKRKV